MQHLKEKQYYIDLNDSSSQNGTPGSSSEGVMHNVVSKTVVFETHETASQIKLAQDLFK